MHEANWVQGERFRRERKVRASEGGVGPEEGEEDVVGGEVRWDDDEEPKPCAWAGGSSWLGLGERAGGGLEEDEALLAVTGLGGRCAGRGSGREVRDGDEDEAAGGAAAALDVDVDVRLSVVSVFLVASPSSFVPLTSPSPSSGLARFLLPSIFATLASSFSLLGSCSTSARHRAARARM